MQDQTRPIEQLETSTVERRRSDAIPQQADVVGGTRFVADPSVGDVGLYSGAFGCSGHA
jgi:hypothetical protein